MIQSERERMKIDKELVFERIKMEKEKQLNELLRQKLDLISACKVSGDAVFDRGSSHDWWYVLMAF